MPPRPAGSDGRLLGQDGRDDRSAEVGVDDDHAATRLGEGYGEVGRHGGLAVARTRRGDEDDPDPVVVGQRLTAGGHERDRGAQRTERLGGDVVGVRSDDEAHRPLLAAEGRQLGDDARSERLLGLAPVADLGVEAFDQQRHAGAEHGPDPGGDRHSSRPRARRREATRIDAHGLGPLERRQRQRRRFVGQQRAVRLVGHAVLDDGRVPLRPEHRVALRGECVLRLLVGQLSELLRELGVELAHLVLQALDVLQGVGLAGLAQLLLALGQVVDRLVGEGVGDADGLLTVLLLRSRSGSCPSRLPTPRPASLASAAGGPS